MTNIPYEALVENALLHVVPNALKHAEKYGLGENHFYISFKTNRNDVLIADYLRDTYPNEMTIVLQHEYSDLMVEEDSFSVTLSFNNKPEMLVIPYRAITRFADPFANFVLSFKPTEDVAKKAETETKSKPKAKNSENVVSLSAFRKK